MATKWIKTYKNVGNGNPLNVAQNIFIDGEDINIPKNLPTFIIGSKNAGKSTIISTLIKAESANETYKRIIYIYTDHVDTTLAETCHEKLIRVPLKHAIPFVKEYLKIKAEYMSWIHFIESNSLDSDSEPPDIQTMTATYTDNIIDEYIRNNLNINTPKAKDVKAALADAVARQAALEGDKKTGPNYKIKEYAIHFVLKYSDSFDLNIENVIYHIDGLRYDQFDQLIIDDVGVAAPYLFPTTTSKSPLYPFLTISRHVLLGTVIAGQDTLQLPKYARKEMNTFLFGVGIAINDVDKTNIPKNKQDEIQKLYQNLKQYDFVMYNGINNTITYLDSSA